MALRGINVSDEKVINWSGARKDNFNNDADAQKCRACPIKSLGFILSINVRDDAINLILSSAAFIDDISASDRAALATHAKKLNVIVGDIQFAHSYQINKDALSDGSIFYAHK